MPQPVILITGASSGIGEATARLFAQEGYRLALAARRFERLEALAGEIAQSGGSALPVVADITNLTDIQNLVATTLRELGQIDVLFNNAGFGRLSWLDTLHPVEDIEAQLRTNLVGTIQTTRAVLPHMLKRRTGHIINMASMAGWVATPTYTIYAASKFGVRGFSDALRREVGVYGIRVSAIYPGGVSGTEFKQHARIRRKTGLTTPRLLRISTEDVARAVLQLTRRPRATVVLPGIMRLFIWLNLLAPGLLDYFMERWFTRRERDI